MNAVQPEDLSWSRELKFSRGLLRGLAKNFHLQSIQREVIHINVKLLLVAFEPIEENIIPWLDAMLIVFILIFMSITQPVPT